MSRNRLALRPERRRASRPAKFAIGVAFAVGAALAADQSAFSRAYKSERLSRVPNVSEGNIKVTELTKQTTASGTMDSHPAQNPWLGTGPANRPPELRLVREDGAGFAPSEVTTAPGKPAPLPIKLSAVRMSESSLLTFRGLPDAVKLSVGFRFQGSWAVSLKDAAGLMLLPDPAYEGAFNLEVSLMKKQEANSPEKQTIRVSIGRQRADGAGEVSIGSGQTTGAESAIPPAIGLGPAAAPKLPATEEAAMVERANTLLQSGDVAAARLVYERLARRGSLQGALAMARTFDPESLQRLGVVGLKPDIAKAKEWYKKAAGLGSREAVNRLAALETSGR